MNKKNTYYLIDIISIFTFVVIDLITKYVFYNNRLWEEFFLLEPAINRWISFSMNMSWGLIIGMTIVALALFIVMYDKKMFPRMAIILLIAWTLGNLYDRIIYYGVRDFLVFPSWFIFNVADVLLFVGMAIAFVHLIQHNKQKVQWIW